MPDRNRGLPAGRQGFTIIELILAVALFAIIAAFTIPISLGWQRAQDVSSASANTKSAIRRAHLLARSGASDATWGVDIRSEAITLFQGSSYVARDSDFDEISTMVSTITPTGISEVTFAPFTGSPSTTGTITLTPDTGATTTLTLNSYGAIE